MRTLNKVILLIITAFVVSQTATAGVYTVTADTNDRTWRSDGSAIWVGQPSAGIGYDGTHRETSHIMPFALPDLGGETISSATLTLRVTDSAFGASLSIDLYGVRADASSTTLATDTYAGAWDISGTNGVAIQQAFVTKTQGNPAPANERTVVSSAAGDTALAAWITSIYSGGASAGDFAFLRLNVDQDYIAGSNSYVYTYTANSTAGGDITGGTGPVVLPTLTLTTIPEPSSLALLALAAASGLVLRKRK